MNNNLFLKILSDKVYYCIVCWVRVRVRGYRMRDKRDGRVLPLFPRRGAGHAELVAQHHRFDASRGEINNINSKIAQKCQIIILISILHYLKQ